MSIADLMRTASSPVGLFEAIIAEDAASATDEVEVLIPAFDSDLAWGPAPWMPRSVAPNFPSQGDRCVVGLAETEQAGTPEVWILAWWPSA